MLAFPAAVTGFLALSGSQTRHSWIVSCAPALAGVPLVTRHGAPFVREEPEEEQEGVHGDEDESELEVEEAEAREHAAHGSEASVDASMTWRVETSQHRNRLEAVPSAFCLSPARSNADPPHWHHGERGSAECLSETLAEVTVSSPEMTRFSVSALRQPHRDDGDDVRR